jgi:DNA repair exonuclease SbcCD nuclease subunit
MKALILFVAEQAKANSVDRIEVLGDLFHNHNVIRLEVMEFWTWALDVLASVCETVVLVGNHDQSGDYNSTFSALSVFSLMNKKNLHIIEKPRLFGVFGYMPYIHSQAEFVDATNVLATEGVKVLICHQTIEGSKYDNGMYAPDGIPAGEWSEKFTHVISGHVHAEQAFGNVLYPGTARWDSLSDANKRKGIWLFEHAANGSIKSSTFVSTEAVCSPIRSIEWKEGDPEPTAWGETERVSVELVGSSVWIASAKEKLKGKCAVKTKITDVAKKMNRQVGTSFEDFLRNLFPSSMDKEHLIKYAKEIGIV